MPRVRFIGDFDYRVRSNVLIAYLAGMQVLVKRDCATAAIAAGKAVAFSPLIEDDFHGEKPIGGRSLPKGGI